MKPILAIALALFAAPGWAQTTAPVDNTPPNPAGYQPPPQPPAPPDAIRVPGPTPDQAYPPPAPLADYPFCKRGQFDKCKQRNDPK